MFAGGATKRHSTTVDLRHVYQTWQRRVTMRSVHFESPSTAAHTDVAEMFRRVTEPSVLLSRAALI